MFYFVNPDRSHVSYTIITASRSHVIKTLREMARSPNNLKGYAYVTFFKRPAMP